MHDQVAEEIRALLARRRMTGRQLSSRLGWTPAYVSRRLTGQIPFSLGDLEALARLLDVPVTDFFPARDLRTPGSLRALRMAA